MNIERSDLCDHFVGSSFFPTYLPWAMGPCEKRIFFRLVICIYLFICHYNMFLKIRHVQCLVVRFLKKNHILRVFIRSGFLGEGSEKVINYLTFFQVSRAIFQRYPNPFASHVLSEDTVYRFDECVCVCVSVCVMDLCASFLCICMLFIFYMKRIRRPSKTFMIKIL